MEIKILLNLGGGANCYLLKTEDAVFVIDPAAEDNRISYFLTENQDKPQYIFLTHCHYDHILGADMLREKFGAKIAICEKDEIGLMDSSVSLSERAGYYQAPFNADITFCDGDIFKEGNTEITVIHTPGHTAGSVCYLVGDVMFTGDTLFQGTVGRTDLPTGNYETLLSSLKKLKSLDGRLKLYPGHGLATTLEREIKLNPYLK